MGPKSNDLIRRPCEDTEAEGHVRMEARLDLCSHNPRNTKDYWQSQEARERQGRILPQSIQREHSPADTLISYV